MPTMRTTTKFDPENHEVPQVTQLTEITSDKEVQTLEIFYKNRMDHYSDVQAPANDEELKEDYTKVAELHMDAEKEPTEGVYTIMQGERWSNPRRIGEVTHENVQEFIGDSDCKHTSMSPGDIIKVNGDLYQVEGRGFQKLHLLKDGMIVKSEDMAELDRVENGGEVA